MPSAYKKPEDTAKEPLEEQHRPRTLSNALNLKHLDADKVLTAFGKYGRYQMIAYMLLCCAMMIFALEMMVMAFIAEVPPFSCEINDDFKESFEVVDKCYVRDLGSNLTYACNSGSHSIFRFNVSEGRTTLATEFNLVCKNEYLVPVSSAIFMIGGMVSTPIITQLSDLRGRRSSYLIPLYLTVISNFVCVVAPNYLTFLIFRFLAGFGSHGFLTVGWVLCTESVSIAFRPMTPLLGTITWFVGYELVGIAFIFFPNWRWHYLMSALPGLLTIPFYWWIPESLHWMITHKKSSGVRRYIRQSSRVNGKQVELSDCHADEPPSETAQRRTFLDILRRKELIFHLILWILMMAIMNIVYWGLSLFSAELSEDRLTGYFLSGLVEVPGGLIGVALLHVLGRRSITAFALVAQALAFAGAVYVTGPGWMSMVFPLFAKAINCVVWASMPLLSSEMIPTTVRNVFFGAVGFFSEFGSVAAPYLDILKEAIDPRAPAFLMCALSAIAAIGILLNPETKDRPLPEDVEQFDAGCLFPSTRRLPVLKEIEAISETTASR